jgi:hypothetical protein
VTFTAIVRNCYIRGFGTGGTGGIGMRFPRETIYYQIYNTRVWNCNQGYYLNVTTGTVGTFPDRRYVENCVAYLCNRGFFFTDNPTHLITFRNCVGAACTDAAYYLPVLGAENPTFENCADDDGSLLYGSGIANNIVPADEFYSLNDGQRLFLGLANDGTKFLVITPTPDRGKAPLEVKFTGAPDFNYGSMGPVLPTGGTTPDYATTDLRGNARPGEDGKISMGVDEAIFSWVI